MAKSPPVPHELAQEIANHPNPTNKKEIMRWVMKVNISTILFFSLIFIETQFKIFFPEIK